MIESKFESIYNYKTIELGDNKLNISGEVILKSETGKSITDTNTSITKENVHEFEPSIEDIKFASSMLKELGFDVFQSGLTITINGDIHLFEKIFKTKLDVTQNEDGSKRIKTSSQIVIPDKLSNVVETIVFPTTPKYFK